jgi:HK97 family phage portal protein
MAILSWLRGLGLRPEQGSGALISAMGGEPTDSGEPVSVDSAMQLATVWACVRLISETVATLPLFLYRKGAKDSRTVAVDEPLYTVLHDSPHADFTAVEFWEGVVASLCLWGNAYAEKQYAAGRLIGLEPLRCDLIEVVRDRNGARVYRYHDPKGRRELSEDQVFTFAGSATAGMWGLSPISFARHSLGTAKAADKTSAKMFANGIRPTGVLEMDQVLKPDQRQQ